MTFRTTTLSAVLALAASSVLAQETRTITVPLGDAATAADGAGFTYSATPNTEGTPTVATATGEAPAPATGTLAQSQEVPAALSGPTPETAAAPGAGDEAAAAPTQGDAGTQAASDVAAAGTGATAEAPAAQPDAEPAAGPDAEPGDQTNAKSDAAVENTAEGQPQGDIASGAEAEAATVAPGGEAETVGTEGGGALGEPAAEVEGVEAGPETVAPADNETPPPASEEPAAATGATGGHISDVAFSFEGPFGTYDQFQLQRGLQVYTEVCAGCHGMQYVPLRTLSDPDGPGLPEDQVRAYAANFDITDSETGEDRPRLPTDHFPHITGEGMGPDLSLMAKARAGFHGPYGSGLNQLFKGIGGPEYIHAILTGYTGETKDEAGATFYENTAFPGGWIQMPPPLSDDQVTYEDGTAATLDNESMDVSAFLMWAAEPKMMARKQTGFIAVIFLVLMSALLYLTNKRLWWPVKHGPRERM